MIPHRPRLILNLPIPLQAVNTINSQANSIFNADFQRKIVKRLSAKMPGVRHVSPSSECLGTTDTSTSALVLVQPIDLGCCGDDERLSL